MYHVSLSDNCYENSTNVNSCSHNDFCNKADLMCLDGSLWLSHIQHKDFFVRSKDSNGQAQCERFDFSDYQPI